MKANESRLTLIEWLSRHKPSRYKIFQNNCAICFSQNAGNWLSDLVWEKLHTIIAKKVEKNPKNECCFVLIGYDPVLCEFIAQGWGTVERCYFGFAHFVNCDLEELVKQMIDFVDNVVKAGCFNTAALSMQNGTPVIVKKLDFPPDVRFAKNWPRYLAREVS